MSDEISYQTRVDKGIMQTFFKPDLSEGFKKFLVKYNLKYQDFGPWVNENTKHYMTRDEIKEQEKAN